MAKSPAEVTSSTEKMLRMENSSSTISWFLNNSGFYLKTLENAEAMDQLPVLVLLGVMSVVGVVGNAIALYVYYTRFTPSSTRTYIITMSVLDLLFCSVTLPGEILDLRFSLTYSASWLCRIHRFISVFLTLFSAMILVAVALDRRRKICFPFRPRMTSRRVSMSVIGCIIASLVIGFPFAVMNGRHSVQTPVEGIVGSACSVDDKFIDTSFPLVYNAVLLLIFFVCFVTMTVSYVQIARNIIQHKRKSIAGAGGAVVSGLALVMGRRPSGLNSDMQQSSSQLERSSYVDTKHPVSDNSLDLPQLVQGSRGEDDVFANDAGPHSSVPELGTTSPTVIPHPEPECEPTLPLPPRKSGSVFQSQSLRNKGEGHVGMAARSLPHALSEDTFLSSELVRHPASPSLTIQRSASVGELPLSPSGSKSPRSVTDLAKIHMTAAIEDSDNGKTNGDAKCQLASSKDNAVCFIQNIKEYDDRKRMPSNRSTGMGEIHQTRVDRNTSSKGESRGNETKRNTRSTSSARTNDDRQREDNHDRHVTLSESRSERFQSLLHNTLTRMRARNQASDGGVTSTSLMRRRHWGKGIPSRTTWMMFILTAIFLISYLPYLVLVCVRATYHDIEMGLHGWKLNLYTLGLKSYFVNSIVNPFVYSFCSGRFRHQCRYLFRRRAKMSISD